MHRRTLIKLAGGLLMSTTAPLQVRAEAYRRVRPGEAGWPTDAQWKELDGQIGGRLVTVPRPLEACRADPANLKGGADCESLFRSLKNPWAIGDSAALTQTSGWADAWASTPSAYAVRAQSAADVATAVNFARAHRLRVAVKGGGHSYQGTSNAPDSLLIWTRAMDRIELHDAFVAARLHRGASAGGLAAARAWCG